MRVSNIINFSYFKSPYSETIKISSLYVASGIGREQLLKKGVKMLLISRLNTRALEK